MSYIYLVDDKYVHADGVHEVLRVTLSEERLQETAERYPGTIYFEHENPLLPQSPLSLCSHNTISPERDNEGAFWVCEDCGAVSYR